MSLGDDPAVVQSGVGQGLLVPGVGVEQKRVEGLFQHEGVEEVEGPRQRPERKGQNRQGARVCVALLPEFKW